MIYDQVEADAPIQQCDIFVHIPRVDLSFDKLVLIDEEGEQPKQATWNELQPRDAVAAVVSIVSVTGIVVTQNCDASRGHYICLAQVDPFLAATGKTAPATPKKWKNLILEHSRTAPRFFYLPPDAGFGFSEPMAADFRIILRVARTDLETLRTTRRIGRLKDVARDHLRENLAYFFRRYAFSEWYPLTAEQFQAYAEECGEHVEPFPWQS